MGEWVVYLGFEGGVDVGQGPLGAVERGLEVVLEVGAVDVLVELLDFGLGRWVGGWVGGWVSGLIGG